MAEILPFRAVRFNSAQVADLSKVVTQPYDKITRDMQARYYDLSPYNLVRIILGRQSPSDSPQSNVYTRASRTFRRWLEEGVLISEREPAVYPYLQHYSLPGAPERRRVRQGFIALCRIEDYSAGVVFRHEGTLAAPKADRLELLRACRAHFGQIFVLYSDPEGRVEKSLAACTSGRPWQQATDEYGSQHALWRMTDPRMIEQIVAEMREKKLVIADGHHRYETALAYRDDCRSQTASDERAEFVIMTFVRKECEGLAILPTHRVVHSLPGFDWRKFLSAADRFFDCEGASAPPSADEGWTPFLKVLAERARERPAFGVYGGPGKFCRLRLRRDVDLAEALPELPASLRQLDVVVLHRLLLDKILGIDPRAVREERNLRYLREPGNAIGQVERAEAEVCFLMNPTPVEAVWENALAGQVLPQKSTDFYPKLLSGLTIYWLDNPLGI